MRKDPSLPFPGYIPQCRLNRGHCMLLSLVPLLACVFCVDGPLGAAFYRSFFLQDGYLERMSVNSLLASRTRRLLDCA
jgi:hypothetical protein